MKKCTWCGKEYADDLETCLVDGQPLSGGALKTAPMRSQSSDSGEMITNRPVGRGAGNPNVSVAEPQWLDLKRIDGAFTWEEGYSRPDWNVIRRAIDQTVAPENSSQAWAEAAIQWAEQLRLDLGGKYSVGHSGKFVLLSAMDQKSSRQILDFSERTLERIYDCLKEAAWQWGFGKHVIFLFADLEDYYQYVSYFYRDGIHPASGGCLIHKDYVHIAMAYGNGGHIRRTLAHELVHNSVVHLQLPLWLNEGLAVTLARNAENIQLHILDGDLRERHFAFWNPTTIQKFWAGVSFSEAGESCELSYNLAEILFHLLLSETTELPAFVNSARREDAGQSAALDVLGADLGQIAATFLGKGEWQPNRKAIADLWQANRPPD